MKIQKKKNLGGVGGGVGVGGQSGCERRIEVFVKIQKKIFFFWGGGGGRGGQWEGSGWGGVRVDVNEELKFFENSKKKKFFFWGGGGVRWGGGVGSGGG